MKNRLELAANLLKNDGIISIQCDDNEYGYLKVLCDEIFGRKNFIATLVWHGRGGRQDSKYIAQVHESILCYAKNKEQTLLHKKRKIDTGKYPNEDEFGKFKTQLIRKWGSTSKKADRPNLFYPVFFEGETILPILPDGSDGRWRWSENKLKNAIDSNLVMSNRRKDGVIELYEKIYQSDEDKQAVRLSWIEETYSGNSKRQLDELFGETPFEFAKPEGLIADLIEMSTTENELVLDFHLGSGTTAAVAHKMGRRYIGIEQMDYIEDITVERLKKVIDGEQGGISKTVNWQGGGSFIYCELKEDGQSLIEDIQSATEETICLLKEKIYKDDRIVSHITTDELINADASFEELSLEDKKRVLMTLVDKNKLYVNYSDIEDMDYQISDADKVFTKSFYEEV